MIGEGEKEPMEMEDEFSDDDAAATIVMTDDSVEINVDDLVAKIESDEDLSASQRKKGVRKRLEELREERERASELDSTYNFNMDDEL